MTIPSAALPSWLDHPCPPWCVREHADDDHLEDRRHQSVEELLSVVRGDYPGPEGGDHDLAPRPQQEWLVVAHAAAGRQAQPPVVWVHLGQEEGREVALDLTRDSARRLRDALSRCLDRLE